MHVCKEGGVQRRVLNTCACGFSSDTYYPLICAVLRLLRRQEMVKVGLTGKLKPIVDTSQDRATFNNAQKALAQLQGQMDI